jgi:hypothetical protein
MRAYWLRIAPWLLLAIGQAVCAQNAIVSEHDLKAAYVYHFIQFTEWPAPVLQTNSALQICISPENPLLRALSGLEGKTVHRKPLVIKAGALHSLDNCQIAIVSHGDNNLPPKNLLMKSHTLTISDDPDASIIDAIIVIRVDNGNVIFSINNTEALEFELHVSSKLLRLARSVR